MSLLEIEDEDKKKKKIGIGKIPIIGIKKLPKIKIENFDKNPSDCFEIISSCGETNNVINCLLDRGSDFFKCLTSGKETLVTNVPCGDEVIGTHYMPYSVYIDWLRCTYKQSGGKADCDSFTKEDEIGRKITTKIICECPSEKKWDGKGCKCPTDKPYDKEAIESAGGTMIGECCAKANCGEGGIYYCDEDRCECAPGWFSDGSGGCTDKACVVGPNGGIGCAEGYCCESAGNCILDDGQWDGIGDPTAPKTISECKSKEGKWIVTNSDSCPQKGHCKLSICDINRTYIENKLVISECDPYCTAEKCDLACKTADPTKCGGTWEFDSCDNKGSPPSCLCACVP